MEEIEGRKLREYGSFCFIIGDQVKWGGVGVGQSSKKYIIYQKQHFWLILLRKAAVAVGGTYGATTNANRNFA